MRAVKPADISGIKREVSCDTTAMSFIIVSKLSPYAGEIIGDHRCRFRCNRSTTDHVFCIRQILEKKWEYNETVHHLFIDFKKACDSARREVLYSILMEFGVPMKLLRLIRTISLSLSLFLSVFCAACQCFETLFSVLNTCHF
jgi:hypothetical protein